MLGVARDVLELADALALDRFGVVAWSGGVPGAVATAFAAPERVTRLALVSGPGPLDEVPPPPPDPMRGPLTLVLFGKIKPYKGADVLIEAFARLPDAPAIA